ncbi:hypothetical protein TSAR_009769 [Trichomalopsis sarcophagae]|uniref:CCHC-type domain-containing protein n=1 Tax=Trichomalopsis sarcophagae TaxID=543379 RepID=A0A232F6E0_9HYME|nr:hypothetical protein TSAR_009769 [Trichomalopsis sarcophagae]
MEGFARAPAPLSDTKPMDKTWKMWKQEFIIFLKAAGFDKKTNEEKAFCLMNQIGRVGLAAMQEMQLDGNEEKDFDILINKFDEYFDPPKRETEERFKFYTRSKKNNEPIEAYIADLKEKAKTCNFGDLTDSLVRDMVILDIKDKHLRKILFQEKELDLPKLTLLYRQFELSTEKMKEVTKKAAAEKAEAKPKDSNAASADTNKKTKNVCWRCGTSHSPGACPAFKVTCDKCNEKGHFTQRCTNKNPSGNTSSPNNANTPQKSSKNYAKSPFSQIEKNKTKN